MVTAAGDRTTRRRGSRRQWPATPDELGAALREAREGSAVTLAEVNDRTGVPWQQLEALESGDLSRFPDQRAALTAVQRYTDLMGLDSPRFARVVQDHWGTPLAGFPDTGPPRATKGKKGERTRGPVRTRGDDAPPAPSPGHLSRYPGDGTHLRAFTQTAQVPGVARAGPSADNDFASAGQFSATGVFPATPLVRLPVQPAPGPLRAAVWCTALLLTVAVAGLAVHHYHPQWLADIHVVRGGVPHATSATSATGGPASKHPSSARQAAVTQTATTATSATVSVRAANFTVAVAATTAPCWVSASTPQSFTPIFGQTLQAGQTADLASANGQLTVNLGSSFVLMVVKINGKAAPGWFFKPPIAPFVINFTSTTAGTAS